MKAINISEFGGPEVCKPGEVAMPSPQSGEATVKVIYAGVNFIDIYMRTDICPFAHL